MLDFVNDYSEGAHEKILQRLLETNMEKLSGYGTDQYCESAKQKIREACECPEADIYFLVGGTQTNATVIDALLEQYEGVVSADTGHISTHEAGAIEPSVSVRDGQECSVLFACFTVGVLSGGNPL